MGCNCCKKRDYDDDLVKESPLICEDLEKPMDPNPHIGQKPSATRVTEKHPGKKGVELTLSPATSKDGPEHLQHRDTSGRFYKGRRTILITSQLDDTKVYEKVGDHFVVRNTGIDGPVVEAIKVKTFITSREHNPFFDRPLDFSQNTLEDFSDPAFIEVIVAKMDEALVLFHAILDLGTEGFECFYDDVKNETGFEMKIFGHTVSTSKNNKIHATKQFFKLKCRPEEFIYVSNDQDIQTKINTNLSLYKNLFVKKTPEYVLELFLSKSRKVMMIDSRESIFVKYCKRLEDGRLVSIGKSILLKGLSTEGPELTTNIQLTGFAYTLRDEDPNNVYSTVQAYNSTDFCSSIGLMLLKPVILKNVKELIKKNIDEVVTLRVAATPIPPLFASDSASPA